MSPPASNPPAAAVSTPARSGIDRALLILTLLGLVARLVFLWLEPRCELTGDEPSWIAIGQNELGRPNRGLWPLRIRLIFYPPVYPYFIAVIGRLFGSVRAVLWAQAFLGALLVPAVGRVGRLAFGRRAGLVAAGIAAFYPELLWYSAHYLSETVYLVLLWWAIERTLAADVCRSARAAAAAGLLWAAATLTRELSLYLVPFAVAWLLRRPLAACFRRWTRRSSLEGGPTRSLLVRAAVLVFTTAVTIAPWTVRNALVYHAFVPVSTMGSLNLWQGNTTLTHTEIYEVLSSQGDPIQQDRYCRRMAWHSIAARQPFWIAEKLREQMPEFWKAGSEVLDHLVGREACGPQDEKRLVWIEAAFVGPYLALLGLFLIGLARLRVDGRASWLLLLLLAYNAAHVVAYATTRFRLPVLPVLFVIAASAIARDPLRPPARWTRLRLALLVALVLLTLATLQPGLEELASWRLLGGR